MGAILPGRSIWFYVLALATVALRQRRVAGPAMLSKRGLALFKGLFRDLPASIAWLKVPRNPYFLDSKGTRQSPSALTTQLS